jgi:2-polyprenyl-3-methyl-5-hydroxy-6-metoxy-1,4-benzoquinol methylase
MNRPTDDARNAYEEWHARLEVDAEVGTPWHQLVKQHIVPGRDLCGKLVLEIGSGRGGMASWLAGQESKPRLIVGADFAHTAVRMGRAHTVEKGLGELAWAVADIQRIAHADQTFDTIVSCETIEHVPAPMGALRELARVLVPGGRLFLTTPNYLGSMGLYRVYMRLRGRRYTEEGQPINHPLVLLRTVRWVRKAGLIVEAVDACGHYLPVPGRQPVELVRLNRPRRLMRWFGLHALTVAVKPRAQE